MRRATSLLVFLSACQPTDQAEKAKPVEVTSPIDEVAKPSADQPASPDAARPTEPASPDASRPSKPAALAPGKVRELRKQYTKLLDEGRTLTKADKLDEAMVKYRAALEIDPSNPTVLGELGWAQFKAATREGPGSGRGRGPNTANALDDAQATTMQALRLAQEDKNRGMLLYNLGRIAEARGEAPAAITYYRTSLEKRPGNATVQGRLDALLAGTSQAAPPPGGLDRIAEGVVDLDAACKQIIDHSCLDFGGSTDPNTDEGFGLCTCESTLHSTPPDDASWGLLTLKIGEWSQEVYFPVVQTSAGWVVFDLIEWTYNPGVFGIYEEVQFGPTTTAMLLPDSSQPQVLFTWKKDRTDSDMGLNEYETEQQHVTVVCARDGDPAWCTERLVQSNSYTRDVEFPIEEEDPPIDHTGLPIHHEYTATFEWRDGKLIVSNVQRKGDPGEQRSAGEYPLSGLLRQ